MSDKLIKLKDPRSDHWGRDDRITRTPYSHAAPFFENRRGVLIHRVRSLYKIYATYASEPWWVVEYWCENYGRTDVVDSGLLFDPGVKLICARCEAIATAKGEPTSSQLAGRHVCTGVCRPVNVCHPNEAN